MKRLVFASVMVVVMAVAGIPPSGGAASAAVEVVPETMSAGGGHTCALDRAGKAWCWGSDSDNQLGDGTVLLSNKYSPVPVVGGRAYTAVTAGLWHTCALDMAGKAWCWGMDFYGQVGDGSSSQAGKYSPVAVAGDRAYTAISAGGKHTCALDMAGKAWCWGKDDYGQVGDGSSSQASKYSPVAVAGDRAYATISAGGSHTCALDLAGKGWCWGWDSKGAVGDGSSSQANKYSPVPVTGGRTFTAISAGGGHTCALDAARKGWCWGFDYYGQAGSGSVSQANKYSPVPVAGGRAYSAISAGDLHTCAIGATDTAWCWGRDYFGQVGDGSASQADKYSPVRVAGTWTWVAVTAGGSHSCGLETTGKARCWGDDDSGQTGGGADNQDNKYSPIPVAGGRLWLMPGTFDPYQ